jgi:hypothetical protein
LHPAIDFGGIEMFSGVTYGAFLLHYHFLLL